MVWRGFSGHARAAPLNSVAPSKPTLSVEPLNVETYCNLHYKDLALSEM